jgi:pimeloyl-ACP methyl ester carboxylesterase
MPKFKTSQDFEIFYDVRENYFREPVFFIHGNLASRRWWIPTAKELERTRGSASAPMICADFRGCGLSSQPGAPQEISVELFAKDFVELLKSFDHLKAPIQLVGHSTGGLVALLMILEEPQLFSRAVLLDPVGAKGIAFNPAFDEAMAKAFEAMKDSREVTAQVLGSTILNCDYSDDFFDWVIVEDGFRAAQKTGGWVVKSLYGVDYSEKLKGVQQPIQILHGSEDQILPMADSQALTELLPNSKFQVLESTGHCLNIENPERLAKVLREHLS